MSNAPHKLTRNQLAEFLPNARAVLAFERVLSQTAQFLPDDLVVIQQAIGELSIEAASGNSRSQQALDLLTSITVAVNTLVSAPIRCSDNILCADYIDMSKTAPVSFGVGRLWWNPSGTLNIGMGGNVTQQVGEASFVAGIAMKDIRKGQLVMSTGAAGTIILAPTRMNLTDAGVILGVAAEDIALNRFGRITTTGLVSGVDTTGTSIGERWANGDVLWYNPAFVGYLTNVKPSAPNIRTQVARVLSANANGSLLVFVVRGSTFGGTDSNVQFGPLANGQLVQYDAIDGYWKNASPSTIAEPPIVLGNVTQYWRGDKTWQDLFAQVRTCALTGLTTASNLVITAADTVISSFGKLQAQVTGIRTGKLSQFASTTSAELATVIPDTTGTGKLVFDTAPILTRPCIATTLGVGALIPSTSGCGISFPERPQPSNDPNTLDDYEEGFWTPTRTGFLFEGTPVSICGYVKVGRLVHVSVFVAANSITIENYATLTLPFTNSDMSSGRVVSANNGSAGDFVVFNDEITFMNGIEPAPSFTLSFTYRAVD